MSSTPPFGFFDPEILATLEQTFNATWPVLEAHEPCLDSEKEAELKLGLSRDASSTRRRGRDRCRSATKVRFGETTANAACICSFELYRKIATDMNARLVFYALKWRHGFNSRT